MQILDLPSPTIAWVKSQFLKINVCQNIYVWNLNLVEACVKDLLGWVYSALCFVYGLYSVAWSSLWRRGISWVSLECWDIHQAISSLFLAGTPNFLSVKDVWCLCSVFIPHNVCSVIGQWGFVLWIYSPALRQEASRNPQDKTLAPFLHSFPFTGPLLCEFQLLQHPQNCSLCLLTQACSPSSARAPSACAMTWDLFPHRKQGCL